MVFSESQLSYNFDGYNVLDEAFSIMDEAVYLTEEESLLSPIAVPIVENSRIGMPIVNFVDVERISEERGISYNEAVDGIACANNLDELAVAVPDYKLIIDPDIIHEMENVVLTPLPENDIAAVFTETYLDAWFETGDIGYLNEMLDIVYEAYGEINVNPELRAKKEKTKIRYVIGNRTVETTYGQALKDLQSKFKGRYETEVVRDKNGNEKTVRKWVTNDRRDQAAADNFMSVIKKAYSNKFKKHLADTSGDSNITDTSHVSTNKNFAGGDRSKATAEKMNGYDPKGRSKAEDFSEEQKKKKGDWVNYRDQEQEQDQEQGEQGQNNNKQVKDAETWLEKVKRVCYNKPKDFIARQIKKIRDWAHNVQNSTESGIWMKIKKIVAKVITTLEGWLSKSPSQDDSAAE